MIVNQVERVFNGAPLYQYFPSLEGLRVFWNGAGGPDGTGHDAGQAYLSGLRITVAPAPCLQAVAIPLSR